MGDELGSNCDLPQRQECFETGLGSSMMQSFQIKKFVKSYAF